MQAWLAGRDLSRDVQDWFDHHVPLSTHASTAVQDMLWAEDDVPTPPDDARVIWLGGVPQLHDYGLQVTNEQGELLDLDMPQKMQKKSHPCSGAVITASWDEATHQAAFQQQQEKQPKRRQPPLLKQLAYDWHDLVMWRQAGLVAV